MKRLLPYPLIFLIVGCMTCILVARTVWAGEVKVLEAEEMLEVFKAKSYAIQGVSATWDIDVFQPAQKNASASIIKKANSHAKTAPAISNDGMTTSKRDDKGIVSAAEKIAEDRTFQKRFELQLIRPGQLKAVETFLKKEGYEESETIFIADSENRIAYRIIPSMRMAFVTDQVFDLQAWCVKGIPLLHIYRFLKEAKNPRLEEKDGGYVLEFDAYEQDHIKLKLSPESLDIQEITVSNGNNMLAYLLIDNSGQKVEYTQFSPVDGNVQVREIWKMLKSTPLKDVSSISLKPPMDASFTCQIDVP